MEIIVHRNVTSDDFDLPATNAIERAIECEHASGKWTLRETADGFNVVGGTRGGRDIGIDMTFPTLGEAINGLAVALLYASLSMEELRKTSLSFEGRNID